MTTRADFRHFERLRVRWAEVDLQKIVFNGHYLMYLDTAVAGYWRAMALPYQATMDQLGGDLYVRKATLDYHASARYDELIDVGIKTARIGNSSMVLAGGVFRGDELLVGGELVYVFANPATQTSLPVPPDLREVLTAFEAGRPMIDVRIGNWDLLGRDAAALRTQVFVVEQKIPAELEWDAADPQALHAVAYNRFGLALATGRLLAHTPGVSKIGRMAVLASLRGSGIGRAVLNALVHAARERGDTQVLLHAQASAVSFYSRAGFVAQGPAFEEAGIPHQAMVKAL
jgi:YbgC/YbaW family acyl-CoA thioester hydrolase